MPSYQLSSLLVVIASLATFACNITVPVFYEPQGGNPQPSDSANGGAVASTGGNLASGGITQTGGQPAATGGQFGTGGSVGTGGAGGVAMGGKTAKGGSVSSAGGQVVVPIPLFVSAGLAGYIDNATTLEIPVPQNLKEGDLMIAMVDAAEGTTQHTVATPTGWTATLGFPIHNQASGHAPYVISSSENHGMWLFYKKADVTEPNSYVFNFGTAAEARGVVVAYRGVNASKPFHDKAGFDMYGSGDTNGYGSGNTTLTRGTVVHMVCTARTTFASYTETVGTARSERFNSGEQANGLNLIVTDDEVSSKLFFGPLIVNKKSPSGSTASYLFSFVSLVLNPL